MHNTHTHNAVTPLPPSETDSRHRGSVLIFVVAILTLLALIGTAFMATVRIDRYAAPPDASDPDETANDLLPGLQTTVVNAIRDDLYDDSKLSRFRPGVPTDNTSRYENWDSGLSDLNDPANLVKQADGWLGERIPTPWDPTAGLAAANPPVWRVVTRPLNGDTNFNFESPYYDTYHIGGAYTQPYYTLRHDQAVAVPSWVTITYPSNTSDPYYDASVAGKTRVFPAFHRYAVSGATLTQVTDSTGVTPAGYLAGDADGDGIADCGLWRLSDVDGVTYYAGVRVIDNNSAINVNTAWSRDHDFNFAGGTLPNNAYFPSNIGLLELLGSISVAPVTGGPEDLQMQAVNHDRFKYGSNPAPYNTSNTPVADGDLFDTLSSNDDPTARADFTFASQGEALYFQLGRRLDNAGFRIPGTTSSPATAIAYEPYKFNDVEPYLAYHFIFVNPDTRPRGLELSLKNSTSAPNYDSVYASAPNFFPTQGPAASGGKAEFTYFPADEMLYWYNYNFEFDDAARNTYFTSTLGFTAAPKRAVRPLLVSSNPVSNRTPLHYVSGSGGNSGVSAINEGMAPYGIRGRWSAEVDYAVNDIVYHYEPSLTPAETRLYLCVQAQTKNMGSPPVPGAAGTPNYWVPLNPRGEWASGATYNRGDVVRVVAPIGVTVGATTDVWIAIGTPASGTQPTSGAWFHLTNTTNSPKVSLNTAPFAELWRGFWSVMSEDDVEGTYYTDYKKLVDSTTGSPQPDPYTPAAGTINWYDSYIGGKFAPYTAPVPFANVNGIDGAGATHPLGMFRSSLREARAPNNTNGQSDRFRAIDMVQLRSAIAAVNAEALRDRANPTIIPSHKIYLNAMYRPSGSSAAATLQPVEVTVYGQKPQPFITEVYANTDTTTDFTGAGGAPSNTGGFIAIELYNPYTSTAINLAGWQFAILDRKATGGNHPDMTVTPVGTAITGGAIPPGGHIVLTNLNDGTGTPTATNNATVYPKAFPAPAGGVTVLFVDGLADAFDHELVLLRPKDTGAPGPIEDWVPVDSYDFTGLSAPADNTVPEAWHYVRANGTGQEWQCVYPGRYDATVPVGQPRHQGTQVDVMTVDTSTTPQTVTDPWESAGPAANIGPIAFGLPDPVSSYANAVTTNVPFSIPLVLDTWPSNLGVAIFPYNGFGRAGEALQVPYIGSYRVRILDPANGTLVNAATTVLELNSVTLDSVFAEDTAIGDDGTEQIGRFCPIPAVATSAYDFASDLLDHFTAIQNFHDDFLPNVDPARYAGVAPSPVSNTEGAVPNSYADQDAPVQGLINVNTAPWPVLAMAPLVAPGGVVDVPNTIQLAKDIVAYRNQNGPFKSIFDLNKVMSGGQPVFQNAENTLVTTGDFTNQFSQVIRLSNLLTTRSDSFTVYLLVQGWKNIGTPYPQLVTERRSAVSVDRSGLSTTTTTPTQTTISSD